MESNSPPLNEKIQIGSAVTTIGGRPPHTINLAEPNLRDSWMATSSQPTSPMTELPLKKKAGLIRLMAAPEIDLVEARRQFEEEQAKDNNSNPNDDAIKSPSPPFSEEHDLESPKVPTHDAEYLDAANEETFTLETFESLIRAARIANKAFLLARVTTVDPKNLSRLYYSYYSAYQINKVIFRTQPEEGLLHRMRSKNPLNNMPIVGDVHYFAIAPIDFDIAWQAKEAHQEKKRVLRTSVSSPLALRRTNLNSKFDKEFEEDNENLSDNNDGVNTLQSEIFMGEKDFGNFSTDRISLSGLEMQSKEGMDPVRENLIRLSLSTTTSASGSNGIGDGNDYGVNIEHRISNGSSPQMRQVDLSNLDELSDDALPVIYIARYFASDDDFLMRSDVRDFFKRNSINPDDYLLFPLNRPTGHGYEMMMIMGADGRPQFRGSHAVPTSNSNETRPRPGARHLWGILDDGEHNSMVGCVPLGIFSPLGFWLIVIIGSAVGVFCGLVYVPTPWNFVLFVGMLAFYVILMLFFVNWEDGRRGIRQSLSTNNNNNNNNNNEVPIVSAATTDENNRVNNQVVQQRETASLNSSDTFHHHHHNPSTEQPQR